MSDNTYSSNNTRDYKAQFQKKVETAARRASQMDVKVFQLKTLLLKPTISRVLVLFERLSMLAQCSHL